MGKGKDSDLFADYIPYLDQGILWPSTTTVGGPIEELKIEDMVPAHALNAYHKLQRWNEQVHKAHPQETKDNQLATQLLEQAVGEAVSLESSEAEVREFWDARDMNLAELRVHDALVEIDAMDTGPEPMHLLLRLRVIMAHLKDSQDG